MRNHSIFFCFGILLFISCSLRLIESGNQQSYNLGKASEFDYSQTIPQVLRKYQYEIYQSYETAAYRTIETEWKYRYPLKDEAEVGIIEGKIRLIFQLRDVSDNTCYVHMNIENMVRTSENTDWFLSLASPMLQKEIDRIIDDLKFRFQENRLTM
jgi:hypothetical protein